jgi:hypothetical protein
LVPRLARRALCAASGRLRLGCPLLAFALVVAFGAIGAQPPAPARLSPEEIRALASIQVQISAVHDSMNALLAQARNKTAAAQEDLQAKLREAVAKIVAANGLTDAEYQRRRFVISTDGVARRSFDSTVAKLTGAPLPGQLATPEAVPVPAGEVGVHLGHVLNSFGDAPDRMGLLPTAVAEARVAAQHAELATRNTSSLEAMQVHAGHVIHALDPTLVTTGPGRGYGLRRAASAVAAQVELAAGVATASQNVRTHAAHVASAARGALARAEQALALGQRIRSATAAGDAASLLSQLVPLCQQLIAGVDANNDGRVSWDASEGGLQQAQEHLTLLLRGEGR